MKEAEEAGAAKERWIGALVLARCAGTAAPSFDQGDVIVAQEYGRLAAVALSHARTVGALRSASRQQVEWLTGLIHDLKTPLTVIHLHAQFLNRYVKRSYARDPDHEGDHSDHTDDTGGDNPAATACAGEEHPIDRVADTQACDRLRDRLAHLEFTVAHMVASLDDLLDVARADAGRPLVLQRQPTNLVTLVQAVVSTHQLLTSRHRIRYLHTDDQLGGYWDARRLERVVDNLLSNAVKYSPAGGEIVVETSREYAGCRGALAVLRVRDEGIGIPEADLETIFEPFRRGRNVAERIPGTGIGLATARQIVAHHGGTIAVASEPGAGTTFTIRLPLAAATARP